jgi:hypothetical protein
MKKIILINLVLNATAALLILLSLLSCKTRKIECDAYSKTLVETKTKNTTK